MKNQNNKVWNNHDENANPNAVAGTPKQLVEDSSVSPIIKTVEKAAYKDDN